MRSFHQKTRLLRLSMLIVGIGIVLMAFATRNYTQLHERLIIQAIGIDWQDGKYQISVHALKTTDEQEVDLFQAQGIPYMKRSTVSPCRWEKRRSIPKTRDLAGAGMCAAGIGQNH